MEDTQMEIFDLEEFKTGKFVVHCSTHQMAKDFLKYLSKLGMKWYSGYPLEKGNYWDTYHSNTVYYGDDTGVTYGYIKRVDFDIRIVKYENLIFPELEVEKDTTFTKVSFPIEEFKKGKFVVHCDTKEKAEKFLKYLASKGLEWSNGDSLIGHNWSSLTSHTNWEIYKDETCYSAENGIEYCNKDYFEKHIYDIKSVDDFLFPFDTADLKEFPIEEFKKGHLTVICDTKEKAEKFLKYLDSQGLKWANDKKATECSYFDKENKMCYTYVDYDWIKGITFGTYVEMLRYQKECDLQFVSSDDYLFPIDDCDSVQDEDNTTETNDTGIVDFVTFNSYTSEGNYEIQLETSDKECYETVGKIIQLYVDKHNSSDKK